MRHPDTKSSFAPKKPCDTINVSYISTYVWDKVAIQKQINADINWNSLNLSHKIRLKRSEDSMLHNLNMNNNFQ